MSDDRIRHTYDTIARSYVAEVAGELAHKPFDRAMLDRFAQRLAGATLPVADVGCGPGHLTAYLAAHGLPMIGIDLSPAMVAEARAREPALHFAIGSMTGLDVADAAWAGAIVCYSIIHLTAEARAAAYRELARVIRPGGWLLCSFHVSAAELPAGTVHHLDHWWGHEVDIETHFLDPADVIAGLAGFTLVERTDRDPIAGVEYPSRRSYLVLQRQVP